MNLSRHKIIILSVMLIGFTAVAQSSRNNRNNRNSWNNFGGRTMGAGTNNIPGPGDYGKFSTFVAERNIFDPNRLPHYSPTGQPIIRTTPNRDKSAPAFTLVGTMAYEKGFFAFFNGNNEEYKHILYVSGKIAGYTVKEVAKGSAVLEAADGQLVGLKVGDVMRQQGNQWYLAGQGEVTGASSRGESASGSSAATTEEPAKTSSSSSSPATEPNDILKRLMEKREQENK